MPYRSFFSFSKDSSVNSVVIKSSKPSETVPDQSLSPQQILDRFVRGTMPNVQREPLSGSDCAPADQEPGAVHLDVLDSPLPDRFGDILDMYNYAKDSRAVQDRFQKEVAENAKKQALNAVSQTAELASAPAEPAN